MFANLYCQSAHWHRYLNQAETRAFQQTLIQSVSALMGRVDGCLGLRSSIHFRFQEDMEIE